MKVLFASSEAWPFAMSGGLADVAGALPKALRKRLVGCRVVLPFYDTIKPEMKAKCKFLASVTVPVAWRRQYCGIFEAKCDGVIYYLIDNQYYFKRDSLYGFYDDAERFAFFSRAVLEMLKVIDFRPDIIHCNDWQTALIPTFLDAFYRDSEIHKNIRTVFTIHNIQYQGKYSMELFDDLLGLPEEYKSVVEYDGCVNFMKAGIESAHKVNTVSPTYSEEIKHPWFAHGMEEIIRERSFKLCGIVNGIDTEIYDPATDKDVYAHYSAEDIMNKAENKRRLQQDMELPVKADTMLIGIVTRLVSHKGIDLVKAAFEKMLGLGVQFVILGSGEWEFENFFHQMSVLHPEQVAFKLGFIPSLARKIYAGADVFLMPSKSEPCGLAQMIALRYGTIPVVRETGGLKDTVTDQGKDGGNGFTFATYNADDMADAVKRATERYADKELWQNLKLRAMQSDNSWGKSANTYIKLYKEIINN